MSDHRSDPFMNHRALLEKVEAHAERVAAAHPLRCAKGCSACCHVQLTVSRVEADHILAAGALDEASMRSRPAMMGGRGALDDHPLFDQLAGSEPCVFLDGEGACAIYPVRPLICRSHGIPVLFEGQVDVCPLNGDLSRGDLPEAPVLNLELLNTTLHAVNARYCRDTGRPDTRVSLRSLARHEEPGP